VHIAEGKLRPEVPLQAAKLASEAGIILRNHVPIFTHWKHYKDKDAISVVKDFNEKVSVSKQVAKHVPIFYGLWITKYIPGC